MANTTFNIASGAEYQTTATVTLGSGERARVRFTSFPQNGGARLVILANATTTYYPVTDNAAMIFDGTAAGDVVSLELRRNSGTFAGILEGVL